MTKTTGVQTALTPANQKLDPSLMNLDGLKIHETTHLPQPNVGEADVGKDGGDDAQSSTKEDEPKNNKDVDNVTILNKIRLEQKCRSVIGKFIRDGKVNERHLEITVNDAPWVKFYRVLQDVVTHNPQVDHTLECQLISYCIQKTQIFHKYLEKIDYSKELLSGQNKDLRALFGQIYGIHNNTEESDTGTFNLHILQGGLNIKKGAATKNFINSHNSAVEKCEPINFELYFCENNVPGQIDVVILAREMERLIIDVAIEYKSCLLKLKTFPEEMRALTETITLVINDMINMDRLNKYRREL